MKDFIDEETPSGDGSENGAFSPLMISHAKIGEFYKIFIPNLIYSILSLGIFRFWARTRNRRYIFSRMNILGDRFEYSGTGGELFKGFLIVFLIIFLPFGVIPGYYANTIILTDPSQAQVIQGTQAAFFFLLFPVAIFRTYKYLFSRISWRGVNFSQVGKTFGYWWRWIGFMMLMPLTLGLVYPKMQVVLSRYLISNSRFGSQAFQMDVQARKIYPAYLVSFLFVGLSFALSTGFVWMVFEYVSNTYPGDFNNLSTELQFLIVGSFGIGILFAVLLSGISMTFYSAKYLSYFISASKLNDCQFKADIKVWKLMKFSIVNSFISLLTLGFGYPIVVCRTMAFIAQHVEASNIETIEQTIQIDRDELKTGEGLADALDVSAF